MGQLALAAKITHVPSMYLSELDEILALADRVIVMNQGRITGELPIHACTEARLGMLMVGERVAAAEAG